MSAKLENIRAEKQLLGCLLRGPHDFWAVESMLSADMFTDPLHQKIYSAIDEVCKRGTVATDVITPVSVKLDGVDFGGIEIEAFLAVMRENADGDADEYVGSVIESWQARSLLDLSKWHDQQIRAGTKPLLELDEDFTDKRRAIMARGAALRPKHISDAANRVMNGSAKAFQDKGKAVGFTTGMPNLDDIMGRVLDEDLVFIIGSQGDGKALALDTPIATPGGWRTMGSLRVGSTVYDERGNPTKVIATSPIMIGRPCFEVEFDDGEVIVADAEHLWVTNTRAGRLKNLPPEARTTREISETLRVESINVANHSISTNEPLQGGDVYLPIPPYTLGAWLGDGHSKSPNITTADAEVLIEIGYDGFMPEMREYASLSNSLAKTYTIRRMGQQRQMIGGRIGSVSPMSFLNDIKVAGLWKNKHIPPVYLRASYKQRLQLLRGLMDTDGTASRVGKCEFCSVNERLAGDVLELLRTMGVKCTLTQGRAVLNGRDCGPKYRIMFSTTLPIFVIKRKADRLKKSLHPRTRTRYIVDVRPVPSVPVKCIQVANESHQYLCGQAMIPTHNSSLGAQVGMNVAKGGAPVLMVQMEMSDEQIAARELAQLSGLSVTKIQVGGFEFDDYDRLRSANDALVASNFWILECDQLSLAQIESQILTMKRLHGCALVIVDQLDKIKADGKHRDKFERLAEVTKGLKSISKRLKIPIICLAQRTRGAQRRDNPTPSILDADAPSIERDADLCIAVFRKYSWLMQNKPSFGPKYQEEMDKWNLERDACVNEAEIICLKRRRGKAFEQRKFTWDGAFTRFIDDRVQDVT